MRDLPVLYPKVQEALGKWKVWVPGHTEALQTAGTNEEGQLSSLPDAILQALLSIFQILQNSETQKDRYPITLGICPNSKCM